MTQEEKIKAINIAIAEYFEKNPSVSKVRAKNLMPHFIRNGIFNQDHKGGLPIRALLRELDDNNQLYLIPSVLVERKKKNRNWFFIKPGSKISITSKQSAEIKRTKIKVSVSRKNSDETYVIDLCDKVLDLIASRQYKFDFLVGDPDKNGKCRKLPVDSYYLQLNLVIEFKEKQHSEKVNFFDKPHKMTVSGVNRWEQREKYDQRRRDILPRHGIKLIEISYTDFKYKSNKKIVRDSNSDLETVRKLLLKSGLLD
jgi:hypothetical protein